MKDRTDYSNEYHRQAYIKDRKRRDGIPARIEAIGKREDERQTHFMEAPYVPVWSKHKRIRVRRVG